MFPCFTGEDIENKGLVKSQLEKNLSYNSITDKDKDKTLINPLTLFSDSYEDVSNVVDVGEDVVNKVGSLYMKPNEQRFK